MPDALPGGVPIGIFFNNQVDGGFNRVMSPDNMDNAMKLTPSRKATLRELGAAPSTISGYAKNGIPDTQARSIKYIEQLEAANMELLTENAKLRADLDAALRTIKLLNA